MRGSDEIAVKGRRTVGRCRERRGGRRPRASGWAQLRMPESPVPHRSSDEFRALAHREMAWIADSHDRAEPFQVLSRARRGERLAKLPEPQPTTGLGTGALAGKPPLARWDEVFRDLDEL